jgi:hypothetical protein
MRHLEQDRHRAAEDIPAARLEPELPEEEPYGAAADVLAPLPELVLPESVLPGPARSAAGADDPATSRLPQAEEEESRWRA